MTLLKVISIDMHENISCKIADAAALIMRDARSLMFVPKCVKALAAVHRVPRRTEMAESNCHEKSMLFSQDRRRSGSNIFVLDHTALQREPLHIAWSRRELCKAKLKCHNAITLVQSFIKILAVDESMARRALR
jgi:hypothetical protein